MFYGLKGGKYYQSLKIITFTICAMYILFNLFSMGAVNAYAAGEGKNTISVDGDIHLKDGWILDSGEKNYVKVDKSYADDYDTDFYAEISSNYKNSYNSEDTALKIDTAKKLAAFSKFINDGYSFYGKYASLTSDINLDESSNGIEYKLIEDGEKESVTIVMSGSVSHSWNPIGFGNNKFDGTFIGNNHTITNMFFKQRGNATGLFGKVGSNGIVKDINVKRATVSGSITGGIAGENNGTISGCTNSGFVGSTGNDLLVGHILIYSKAGGIVGDNRGTIINCENNGAVSSYFSTAAFTLGNCFQAGGIVGDNKGTINGCGNSGAVSLGFFATNAVFTSSIPSNAGGIAGESKGTISGCENSGTISPYVSATNYSTTCDANSGGIVGKNKGKISNCKNSGEIFAYAFSDSIYYFAYSNAGGIVGLQDDGSILDCLSVSRSIGGNSSSFGGIAGRCGSRVSIKNCYYDKNVVCGDIGGAINGSDCIENNVKGLSTSELKSKDDLFSSGSIWLIKYGNYPVLDRISIGK